MRRRFELEILFTCDIISLMARDISTITTSYFSTAFYARFLAVFQSNGVYKKPLTYTSTPQVFQRAFFSL